MRTKRLPDSIIETDLSFFDFLYGGWVVFRFKWSISGDDFVDGDAQSPIIYLFIIATSDEYLWSLIEMRSNDS